MEALTPKLSAKQAKATIVPILGAIITNQNQYQLGLLADTVRALAPRFGVDPAQARLPLEAITTTTNAYRLRALAELAQALGASPEQAQAALVSVLEAITVSSDAYELLSLAQAVEALGASIEQVKWALVPVLKAIATESNWALDDDANDRDQLRNLFEAVEVLGSSPEQALTVLVAIVNAITATSNGSALETLARAVEALAPKLGAEQAQTALVPVLAAIISAIDAGQMKVMAKAVAALAPKLARSVSPSEFDTIRSVIAWVPNTDIAAAFAAACTALLARETKQDFIAAVVTGLSFPMMAGPATDVLTEALREVGGPGKEAGLDATLAWLREAYPNIDPDAVPVCPPPPAGWEGLQCPPA